MQYQARKCHNMESRYGFRQAVVRDGTPDSWSANKKFTRSNAIPAIDGSYVGRFFTTDNTGTNSTLTVAASGS